MGIDQSSPYHWKQLSLKAKEAIVHFLSHVEKHDIWPGYLYYHVIVLMGKPAGGSRPIALMPMLYRLWTKIRRPHLIRWELAHQGPWDAAVKGSPALKAGLLSLLREDMAIAMAVPGQECKQLRSMLR